MSTLSILNETPAHLLDQFHSDRIRSLYPLEISLLSFAHFARCLRPTLVIRKLGKFIACENATQRERGDKRAWKATVVLALPFWPSTFLHYRYTNFTSGWLGKRKEKKKGRGEISKRWEKQARRVGIFFLGGRGETITISANISKGLDNYQRAAIPPCPRRGSIHPFLNPRRVEKKISWSFRGRDKNFVSRRKVRK